MDQTQVVVLSAFIGMSGAVLGSLVTGYFMRRVGREGNVAAAANVMVQAERSDKRMMEQADRADQRMSDQMRLGLVQIEKQLSFQERQAEAQRLHADSQDAARREHEAAVKLWDAARLAYLEYLASAEHAVAFIRHAPEISDPEQTSFGSASALVRASASARFFAKPMVDTRIQNLGRDVAAIARLDKFGPASGVGGGRRPPSRESLCMGATASLAAVRAEMQSHLAELRPA